MSLIYQSLKKLQSEDTASSGPRPREPDALPVRGFLRRSLFWLLPSALIVALGGLIAWNLGLPPQESSKPPQAATVPDEGNQTTGPNGTRQKKVAAKGPSDEESSERSQESRGTQKIGTGTGAEDPSEKNKPQRLLHFACTRNGTRARLSLELQREPKLPKTTWTELVLVCSPRCLLVMLWN